MFTLVGPLKTSTCSCHHTVAHSCRAWMAVCAVLTTGLALLTSLSLRGKNKGNVYNRAAHLMQRWSVSGGITFTCHATFGTGATGWNCHLLPCIVLQYTDVSPRSEQMVRSAVQQSPKLLSRLLGKRENHSYQNVVKPPIWASLLTGKYIQEQNLIFSGLPQQ